MERRLKPPLLEVLPARARFASFGRLFRLRLFPGCRPAKDSVGKFPHFRVPEFPCGSPCAFFSAVAVIAKKPGHRCPAAQKMDLKTVGLFFGARFCVDAPDVLF